VDPETSRVTAQVPLGRGPRAGGDLTGSASGGQYEREGAVSHVFGGCGREARVTDGVSQGETDWRNVRVVALVGAGGRVSVAVRRADDEAGLADAAYEVLGELGGPTSDASPFPLTIQPGGVIEVQLRLMSEQAIGAPRIVRVGVEWRCSGPD
jgi:hypothetical protein